MKFMKTKNRFLLAVAVAALLVAPFSRPLEASAGRDYSRCINGCNAVRQACTSRCSDTCRDLFPNDVAARNACLDECKGTCLQEDKECKDRCQAIKNGVSPTEP